jgi:hypothetical protein
LFSGLGALGWPAKLHAGQEDGACSFMPDLGPASKALHWLFIDDLSKWEARELHFRSPLWGCLQAGDALPCITAQASQPEPLLTIAARQAFWHIPKAALVKLSEHEGLAVETGWSLFSLLWNMLKKFLPGMSDEQYLGILQKRLTPKQLGAIDMCDIDIVEDMLDKSDLEEMRKAKKEAEKDEKNLEIFTREFEEMKSKVTAKLQQAKRPQKKQKTSAASSASSSTSKVLPEGELTREQVLALAPPGCHIWRSRAGTWQINQPPHPRLARSWSKYGEREAAVLVLQGAWRQYLGARGQDISDCDIRGLF